MCDFGKKFHSFLILVCFETCNQIQTGTKWIWINREYSHDGRQLVSFLTDIHDVSFLDRFRLLVLDFVGFGLTWAAETAAADAARAKSAERECLMGISLPM